jgi:hypothetical protein
MWLAEYDSDLPYHDKVFTENNPALIMGFRNIYAASARTAYGTYYSPGSDWECASDGFATVVIDPSNGRIIDVVEPNCLYQMLPITNSHGIGQVQGYYAAYQ